MQPFRDGLFEGRVALVTGGGSGIGLATAHLLGGLGARVAICGRTPERLERAARALRGAGVAVCAAPCDIRRPEEVAALLDRVEEAIGPPDLLVNNAGGQFPAPAEAIPPRGFEAVVRNNLLGTWNVTHAVAHRALFRLGRGSIVNVTAQVRRGFPGMAHTGAARAGVENLTMTLAVEWARHGIRVNAVAPGVVRSSGTRRYGEAMLEAARRATPARRLGTPEEVAWAIAYLLSDAAAFITGHVLRIDGGQALWGDIWTIPDDHPLAHLGPHPEETSP